MSLTKAMDNHRVHDGLPCMQDTEISDVKYIAGCKILVKTYECMVCHELIETKTVINMLRKDKE